MYNMVEDMDSQMLYQGPLDMENIPFDLMAYFEFLFGYAMMLKSGQTIRGCLILESTSYLYDLRILIHLRGRARTTWVETVTGKIFEYSENHVYSEQPLQCPRPESPGLLPPGLQTLYFSFRLPPSAPSTFECDFGCITYKIEAQVQQGQTFLATVDKDIFVLSTVRPNHLSIISSSPYTVRQIFLRKSSIHEFLKYGLSLCMSSPPFAISGEYFNVDLVIKNRTLKNRSNLCLLLYQQVLIKSKRKDEQTDETENDSKFIHNIVDTTVLDTINKMKCYKSVVKVYLPRLLPPTSVYNSCVNWKYVLKLEAGGKKFIQSEIAVILPENL
uniref:Arrestin-like N-terminal domain-containing protein n=1 Tax=Romanomermis culicivorax TaxID=13658 RepID=A0A915INN0_ROMCU